MTYYGLTPQRWQATKDEILEVLIGVAKVQTTITYGELAAQLTNVAFHPGAYGFHALLRDVCRDERQAGRGMLCALVVRQSDGRPGQGFFKAMLKAGRDCHTPEECWRAEVENVYRIWSDTD